MSRVTRPEPCRGCRSVEGCAVVRNAPSAPRQSAATPLAAEWNLLQRRPGQVTADFNRRPGRVDGWARSVGGAGLVEARRVHILSFAKPGLAVSSNFSRTRSASRAWQGSDPRSDSRCRGTRSSGTATRGCAIWPGACRPSSRPRLRPTNHLAVFHNIDALDPVVAGNLNVQADVQRTAIRAAKNLAGQSAVGTHEQ